MAFLPVSLDLTIRRCGAAGKAGPARIDGATDRENHSLVTAPRIASIEPVLLRLPLPAPLLGPFGRLDARPNLLVIVTTDDGASGLGEIWANFPPWGCRERSEIVRHVIAPLLVGEPLDDPTRLYARMQARLRLLANQWGAPGPVHQAIAGTDIALWDAYARSRGVALATLLRSGPAPTRVPVYASGIAPPDVAGTIAAAQARGHRRFKVRLAFGAEADRATLRAGRAAAGTAPLMADANQTLDATTFAALAPLLSEAGLQWLEEPFPVDDLDAYRRWPRALGVPLAFGENARGEDGLERVIELGADVVQPDITKTLGITGGLTVGRRVVAAGRRLCFHMYGGAVGLYASAHLAAAIDGADWLEMDAMPNPLLDETLTTRPEIIDGALILPDGPGLGIALAPRALPRSGDPAGWVQVEG
jgi:D-galactarolactone cycloisomerase